MKVSLETNFREQASDSKLWLKTQGSCRHPCHTCGLGSNKKKKNDISHLPSAAPFWCSLPPRKGKVWVFPGGTPKPMGCIRYRACLAGSILAENQQMAPECRVVPWEWVPHVLPRKRAGTTHTNPATFSWQSATLPGLCPCQIARAQQHGHFNNTSLKMVCLLKRLHVRCLGKGG